MSEFKPLQVPPRPVRLASHKVAGSGDTEILMAKMKQEGWDLIAVEHLQNPEQSGLRILTFSRDGKNPPSQAKPDSLP